MPSRFRSLLPYLLLIPLALLCFTGLDEIPFHPDEATFIYTSQEFEVLITDPLSLSWEPGKPLDALDRYRLMDEPLSRLVFGAALQMAGIQAASINSDWDWSRSWDENLDSGAFPDGDALLAARTASTLFSFAALALLFAAAKQNGSLAGGIAVVVFMGLNALILLHGRRAMREGLMLFGLALVIWILPHASRRPWAAGLAAALALAARYSLAPLGPVALLASVIPPIQNKDWRRAAGAAVQFAGAFTLLFLLLHPVLWKHPVQGLQEMVKARAAFTREGVETLEAARPDLVLDSWQKRAGVLLYHTFLSPPAYYDVGNYAAEVAPQIAAYEAGPLHTLWRGLAGGGIAFALALGGALLGAYRLLRGYSPLRMWPALIILAGLLMAALILAANPFPIQRYYLALLPFTALLAGSLFIRRKPDSHRS